PKKTKPLRFARMLRGSQGAYSGRVSPHAAWGASTRVAPRRPRLSPATRERKAARSPQPRRGVMPRHIVVFLTVFMLNPSHQQYSKMWLQLEDLFKAVEGIVLDPQLADILAIVKGARNGFTYGAKIRFPHALVMVFLFRSGTLREKLKLVSKATFQHARNLATFATIYKTALLFLRNASPEGKESSPHTFIAGLIGGYMVFGRGIQSSVNQQIVIYVFARVVLALARLSVQKGGAIPREFRDRVTNNAWPVFAALSWASVMWLYRWQPETLQPSLKSSMKYMYGLTHLVFTVHKGVSPSLDSNHWDSFRTLLLQNK
ncbi:MAG: hypothetical protein Q9204_004697, partial [Flavoplaca sp. TL-2023a]